MSRSVSRLKVRAVLTLLAALPLAACSTGSAVPPAGKVAAQPERILAAPRGLLAAGQPQSDGVLWTLAGTAASRGLS